MIQQFLPAGCAWVKTNRIVRFFPQGPADGHLNHRKPHRSSKGVTVVRIFPTEWSHRKPKSQTVAQNPGSMLETVLEVREFVEDLR